MTAPGISIVGIACRYPDADGPEQLWQNVLAGRRAFRQVPEVRLPSGYRGSRDDVDRTYLTHAAVLRDWEFDRPAFGVPGPLHRAADHTHWLALETAAAALADAGRPRGEGLDRDRVGVILGNSLAGEFSRAAMLRLRWPFVADAAARALDAEGVDPAVLGGVLARMERLVKDPFPVPGDESLAGALANTIAGRICNTFDFHGTGYTVDGACSSSLLAVGQACSTLASGDCDVVVTGGVDMSLDPLELVGFSRLGALATGEMRVYDADPTGFLPGEGCGMFVLVRSEDVRSMGLRSYADIVGWATSSDGAGGLTRPGEHGQRMAISRAYQRAGLEPAAAELLEGHGTGTPVGDDVEMAALTAARGLGAPPAALGSIKANIGHTKAAAGAAGLLKVTQALHRRLLPPTTGCRTPHPRLTANGVPLRTLAVAEEWTSQRPVAGVSSMGFGGINAHVVVQAAEDAPRSRRRATGDRRWARAVGDVEVFLLAAADPGALMRELAGLEAAAGGLSCAELRDVAATRWRRGADGPFRAALVARTPEELVTAAGEAAAAATGWSGVPRVDAEHGWALGSGQPARVGLLLPGQAAPVRPVPPWWASPLSSDALDAVPVPIGDIPDTATAQPWIVAQSLFALGWLEGLGCEPALAVGHSLGEISALCWAGALSPEAALALATARGRLMAELGSPDTGMVALAAGPAEATALVEGTGLTIAGYNAPDRVVLSGARPELDALVTRAARAGVAAVTLPVSHGFHSAAMAAVEGPLRDELAVTPIRPLQRSLISTTDLSVLGPDTSVDDVRKSLVTQLTSPVLFSEAARHLAGATDLLIEAGPGTVLTGMTAQSDLGVPVLSMDAGGDPRRHAMVTAALAACAGADLEAWFEHRPHRVLDAHAELHFVPSGTVGVGSPPAASIPVLPPAVSGTPAAALRTAPVPVPAGPATEPVEHAAPEGTSSSDEPDVLAVVVGHLAETLELPVTSIRPELTLLGDLHLSSLQAVQTVAAAARALGVEVPASPASVGLLTVGALADLLADQTSAGPPAEVGGPAGVRPWVRAFGSRWDAVPEHLVPAEPTRWTVDAPDGHPWHALPQSADARRRGLAVGLTGRASAEAAADLVQRVVHDPPDVLLVGHSAHRAATGLARALHAELDGCDVVVVDLPGGELDEAVLAAVADAGPTGFRELVVDAEGVVRHRVPQLVTPAPVNVPLHPGDVCLVTGGAAGISALCAGTLARATGATLVVLGRSAPDDPRVAGPLTELRGDVEAHYLRCDITDAEQVGAALGVAAGFGPVRGLLHGAAVNAPQLIGAVTAESLRATLAPKVDGLQHLLDEVGADLTLLVAFGSIIGRQGLAGQSEYCIANDWMRCLVEEWAADHPGTRARVVEWSVWDDTGMAARMGVLDSLAARGVRAIQPADGVALLTELLGDPAAPVTVLATSRFASTPTLSLPAGGADVLRFGERREVHVAGVETVLEADLSHGSDPYLLDHRVGGVPVLPAVLGMEAMTQVAALLRETGRSRRSWALEQLRFDAPVTLGAEGRTVLRSAGLRTGDEVETVLRAGTDEFAVERFRGRVTDAPPEPAARPVGTTPEAVGPHPFYGRVFFHEGRFRRLVDYEVLSAFRVRAWIRGGQEEDWFSPFHGADLLLGDPGAHDAALHVLLPCVPHRLALPVAADRFVLWQRPAGPLRVDAVERWHGDGEYCFDVDVTAENGAGVARWEGLRLRATGPVSLPDPLPVPLVGPWLSRRLVESGFSDPVDVVTPDAQSPALFAVTGGPDPARTSAARAVVFERTAEVREVTTTRLRAAVELLAPPAGGPDLAVGQLTDDGLVEFRSGDRRVVTARVRTDEGDLVVAVETGQEKAALVAGGRR